MKLAIVQALHSHRCGSYVWTRGLCYKVDAENVQKLGGGFKDFYFHPNPWGDDRIWWAFIFSDGLKPSIRQGFLKKRWLIGGDLFLFLVGGGRGPSSQFFGGGMLSFWFGGWNVFFFLKIWDILFCLGSGCVRWSKLTQRFKALWRDVPTEIEGLTRRCTSTCFFLPEPWWNLASCFSLWGVYICWLGVCVGSERRVWVE